MNELTTILRSREEFLRWFTTREATRYAPKGIGVIGADLSGLDLANCNLGGTQFDGVDLTGVNFNEACLNRISANKCNLRGACLRKAEMSRAVIQATDMSGAQLQGAVLHDTRFEHCQMIGIDMTDAQAIDLISEHSVWDRLIATRAQLSKSWFQGCSLKGASFEEARLYRAGFHTSDLSEACFAGANIARCGFSQSDLRRADFVNCITDEGAFFWQNKVHGARALPLGNAQVIKDLDFSEAGDGSGIRPEFNIDKINKP
jgi:uncharacterized protein YjbI with pentapeptide repeats